MPHAISILWLSEPALHTDIVGRWLRTPNSRISAVATFEAASERLATGRAGNCEIVLVDDSVREADMAKIAHWRQHSPCPPHAPVVFLSASHETAFDGNLHTLAKPVHGEDLMAAMRRLLPQFAGPTAGWYSGEILLIDCEPDRLDIWSEALDLDGFDITETPHLDDAFSLLQHIAFDLVIADAGPRGRDGTSLLRFASSFRLSLPIVMIADSTVPADWRTEATALGATEIVRRATKPASVLPRVRELVAAQWQKHQPPPTPNAEP